MAYNGRLPPLQRSNAVDDEDDADDGDSDDSDIYNMYAAISADEDKAIEFDMRDVENTATALSHSFRVFNPGNHVCKRNRDHAMSFAHCACGVAIGEKYAQLRTLMERRAKLEFIKDYNIRLNSVRNFVEQLESVVNEEYRNWALVNNGGEYSDISTRLDSVSGICEELRMHHVNHWNCVKQHLHTNKWLRPLLPSLCLEIDQMRVVLTQYRDLALWWVDKFIRTGLQVLAHVNHEEVTQEMLWHIARGIEDFNSILSAVRHTNAHEVNAYISLNSRTESVVGYVQRIHHPICSNAPQFIGNTVKTVPPFTKVLQILANERSKAAAKIMYTYFTENDALRTLIQTHKFDTYTWENHSPFASNNSHTNDVQTSDYQSSSSLSSPGSVAKVANVEVPDLSNMPSPLVIFGRREKEFASTFFGIVCSSTNIFRRSGVKGPVYPYLHDSKRDYSNSPKSRKKLRDSKASAKTEEPQKLQNVSEPPGPMFSRSDPKRKSVTWGDNADNSVKLQLTARYMDAVWQYLGGNLYDMFYSHPWRHTKEGQQQRSSHLGHFMMCPDALIAVVVATIQNMCTKEMFPVVVEQNLQHVAWKLQSTAAVGAWDSVLCECLGSLSRDKCNPIPLVNGEVSTSSAKLLRDSLQPLMSIMHVSKQPPGNKEKRKESSANDAITQPNAKDLEMIVSTLPRILVTGELCVKWCHIKSNQFLSGWAVAQLLLVTQSDLKILADEMKKVLFLSQSFTHEGHHGNNQMETQLIQQVNLAYQQLSQIYGQLQTLSGSAMKLFSEKCSKTAWEYFQDSMPVGKVWKKKSNQDFPTQHNEYVDLVLYDVLKPVVLGVSQLKPTAQLGALSVAVVAVAEAWTRYILQQRPRFSLYGAHQLQVDFMRLRTWLGESIQNPAVHQSVLALDIFKYLQGAVILLKRQPQKKGGSYVREETSGEFSTSTSLNSVSRSGSIGGGSVPCSSSECDSNHDDQVSMDLDMENYQMPNQDDWLALRVHGGTRAWKFSTCFNKDSTE